MRRSPGWSCHHRFVSFVVKIIATAIALWVAATYVDGISVTGASGSEKAVTLLGVAVIFGLVNAFIKPIIKGLGCGLYVLTLGLIGLVVNALLFLLVDYLAAEIDLPFDVDGFVPAFWGAIVVAVVAWVAQLILDQVVGD